MDLNTIVSKEFLYSYRYLIIILLTNLFNLIIVSLILIKYKRAYKDIPGPKGNFLFGNARLVIPSLFEKRFAACVVNLSRINKCNGKGLFKLDLSLFGHLIILFSASKIRPLLQRQDMIDKPALFSIFVPWLGNSIYTLNGDKWKTRRKILQPTFKHRKVEMSVQSINRNVKNCIQYLNERIDANKADVHDISGLIARVVLNILCESMMGFKMDEKPDIGSAFIESFEQIIKLMLERAYHPIRLPDFAYFLTNKGKKFFKHRQCSIRFAQMLLNARKDYLRNKQGQSEEKQVEDEGADDIYLDQLIRQQQLNPNQWTDADITHEIQTLMFGGLDTTINSLPYTLLLIGLDDKIQDRIQEELKDIYFDDRERDFTLEDSNKMVYLENCIKESLRLFPPVPMYMRRTRTALDLDEFRIPANTECYINVFELHRDPTIYPNPELFEPDRFLKQNMTDRSVYDFLPFSAGPRICIGQKFAMVQMKAILSGFFRHFRIKSLTKRNELIFNYDIVLKSMVEISIRFEKNI